MSTNDLEFPVVENFTPEVPVEIYTMDSTLKIVALIDTGSTGFLSIPLATGVKANLRLFGVGYYTMADGRKVKKIQCIGKIRFAGKDLFGIISLSETSDDCLLGMQFLSELGMNFTVSTKTKKAIFSETVQAEVASGKKAIEVAPVEEIKKSAIKQENKTTKIS